MKAKILFLTLISILCFFSVANENSEVTNVAMQLIDAKTIEELETVVDLYADQPKVLDEAIIVFELFDHECNENQMPFRSKKNYLKDRGLYSVMVQYKLFYLTKPVFFNALLCIVSLFLFLLLQYGIRKFQNKYKK